MADTPSFDDLAADLAGPTDVNDTAVEQQDTTPEAPSAEENKSPEVADSNEGADSEADPDLSQASDDEEQNDADQQPTNEQPQRGLEARTDQVNGEIRDLITQRNELRSEVERLNAQVYAPQSVDDIMQETGQDEAMARITAMEQRQELSDYNNRVAEAQLVISSESERVLNDFPMFNPSSAEYNPEVAAQAAQLLQSNLVTDPNTGQLVGSNISPYALYKTIASANQVAAVQNQVKGKQAALQQEAAADFPSSAAPRTPKEDPFLAGLLRGIDSSGS